MTLSSKNALAVCPGAPEATLRGAALHLDEGGTVLFDDVLAIRRAGDRLHCEVLDPEGAAHRCAEEFSVLVENARRALEASGLNAWLPALRRHWSVVVRRGETVLETWHAPRA